jgi:ABC-type antimicrobial peptide transport system permease subunit
MASIWQDIRFGLRMLRHAKGVTAVAVISLALAIAGNTAVFGLVNARFNVGLNLFNVILGGFGFLALVLAAIGTDGVLAYDVAQRSHEIGVRLAMGSPRSRLLRLFLKQGLVLGVIGLVIGTPGVIAIALFVRSLLVVFSPPHSSLVIGAATTLFVSTLAASLLPVWRATRYDPATILRRE